MMALFSDLQVANSVFIPEANWLMMVLTVVCIAIFKTTTVLGNAYGLCVSAMAFITTLLASLAFLMAFNVPVVPVILFLVFFGFIDCVFLSANLIKVSLQSPPKKYSAEQKLRLRSQDK